MESAHAIMHRQALEAQASEAPTLHSMLSSAEMVSAGLEATHRLQSLCGACARCANATNEIERKTATHTIACTAAGAWILRPLQHHVSPAAIYVVAKVMSWSLRAARAKTTSQTGEFLIIAADGLLSLIQAEPIANGKARADSSITAMTSCTQYDSLQRKSATWPGIHWACHENPNMVAM